jgi:carbamoyltransferase
MREANSSKPWILGVSASHNGSACLLHGNDIAVAVQEERLTRKKRQAIYGAEPSLAVQYCLDSAGVKMSDVDSIVVSVQGNATEKRHSIAANPQFAGRREDATLAYASHHLCHAISAYATSGFDPADVLVIDGVGSIKSDLPDAERALAADGYEWLSCYQFDEPSITPLIKHMGKAQETAELTEAYSLGSLFELVSKIIFGERMQAGKVMGLAAYGKPSIPIEEFLHWDGERIVFAKHFQSRFTGLEKWPENGAAFADLASSVQCALEETVLQQLELLRSQSSNSTLCYAGGVALNTLLNERIIRESGYENIHIIPAAEDSGIAIGAAYHGLWQIEGQSIGKRLQVDTLGHKYSEEEVSSSLASLPGILINQAARKTVIDETVERLCAGEIGGCFDGGSELGPRALGHRSMICDPRPGTAKDHINSQIKKREHFRPFAPMVLEEHATQWFDFGESDPSSPFMLRVADVPDHLRNVIPAIVHEDGSARVQTVGPASGFVYSLLQAFYAKTGVPVLLNTSLNVNGEPIVETPLDAWRCLLTTRLSFCVIEGRLLTKQSAEQSLLDFCPLPTFKRSTLAGSVALPSGERARTVKIWSDGPWGEIEQEIPMTYFHLLKLMDGHKSGVDLMEDMGLDPQSPDQRNSMLSTLQLLHQKHALRYSTSNG